MSDRDRFQTLMIEHLYGLLDADEARELEAYLATPAGAGLRAEADGVRVKLANAARVTFPRIRFVPPATTEPIRPTASTTLTMGRVWTGWAVAACLMVVVGGLGLPAAYQIVGWTAQSGETNRLRMAMNDRRADLARGEDEKRARTDLINREHAQALAAEQAAEKAYQDALTAVQKNGDQKELTVLLTGPARAIPGAPNEWRIETLNKQGIRGLPRKLEVVVKDQHDTELVHQTYDRPDNPPTLKLSTAFWQTVKPGSDLYLEVVAFTEDNRRSVLAERVPLAGPVHVTHLVTDKPMYRPGEMVRFRSLTLDRGTLLPPDQDLNLEFRLHKPDGGIVPAATTEGNGRLVRNLRPVIGPDGKPVRGIGAGEYELPRDFPGGEYTLTVVDKGDGQPNKETVLDRRRFLVNQYVPDQLEKTLEFGRKSYGPGDEVEARIEVTRSAGGPISAPRADTVVAMLNGKSIHSEKGTAFQVIKDAGPRGVLTVRFRLPDDLNANRARGTPRTATLAVAVRDGNVAETILKPIPLVDRELEVEFFPEGGDLVAGVSSRVYFQVRTPAGKPADLRGTITDGTNVLAEVATVSDGTQSGVGRGQVAFTVKPQRGKNYFLKLQSPVGIAEPTKDGFALPEVKADGIVLTSADPVTAAGKPIRVRVESPRGPKVLHVGAYARGRLIDHQRVELAAGAPAEVDLKGDQSLGGVVRVTVFEELAADGPRAALVPRAERLVFRRPAEELRFGVTPDKDLYGPADKAAIDISTTNEKGQPTPAIVMVGVVNQSVLTMADMKTDRLLPTQVLIAGEVRDGADLEHADFLLTDHPKAAQALDLLLGTQGWRRFAEQRVLPADPGERQEVERMLVAHGGNSATAIRPDAANVARLTAEFRPKLEQNALRLIQADQAVDRFRATEEPTLTDRTNQARSKLSAAEHEYESAAAELYRFETRAERARGRALPLLLLGLLGLAIGGAAVAVMRAGPERRRYVLGSVGAAALGVLALLGVVMTRGTMDAERAFVKMDQMNRANKGGVGSDPGPVAKGADNHQVPPEINSDLHPAVGKEKTPGVPRGTPLRTLKDAEERARLAELARQTVAIPGLTAEGTTDGQKLEVERKILDRVAEMLNPDGRPGIPQAAAVEQAPAAPPFIVREYAHVRPTEVGPAGDHAETIFWHPALVIPDGGHGRIEFQLPDDLGRFRVLIAGHTTDGRVGAIVRTIENRK